MRNVATSSLAVTSSQFSVFQVCLVFRLMYEDRTQNYDPEIQEEYLMPHHSMCRLAAMNTTENQQFSELLLV